MVIASAFAGHLPAHRRSAKACSAPRSMPPSARRIAAGDRGPRRRLRRAGGGDAVDHAGLARRPLEPRPFILRLFLARVGDGWPVMPGGFVRIADDVDARAVSLQRGGRTADAWVLSEGPVAETTLLPTPERIAIKRATGVLPSRAADNLFWVGALRRARRGDAAAGARADQPHRPKPTRPRRRVVDRDLRAARRPGAPAPTDIPHAKPALDRARGAAAPRCRRRAAVSRRRRALGGFRDSRPLFARRLARAQRPGRD